MTDDHEDRADSFVDRLLALAAALDEAGYRQRRGRIDRDSASIDYDVSVGVGLGEEDPLVGPGRDDHPGADDSPDRRPTRDGDGWNRRRGVDARGGDDAGDPASPTSPLVDVRPTADGTVVTVDLPTDPAADAVSVDRVHDALVVTLDDGGTGHERLQVDDVHGRVDDVTLNNGVLVVELVREDAGRPSGRDDADRPSGRGDAGGDDRAE